MVDIFAETLAWQFLCGKEELSITSIVRVYDLSHK